MKNIPVAFRVKVLILNSSSPITATTSIDFKTNETIQTSLIAEFAGSTVLCITHRLKSIIRYDRVIVLGK